jgi:hypothetical protein
MAETTFSRSVVAGGSMALFGMEHSFVAALEPFGSCVPPPTELLDWGQCFLHLSQANKVAVIGNLTLAGIEAAALLTIPVWILGRVFRAMRALITKFNKLLQLMRWLLKSEEVASHLDLVDLIERGELEQSRVSKPITGGGRRRPPSRGRGRAVPPCPEMRHCGCRDGGTACYKKRALHAA